MLDPVSRMADESPVFATVRRGPMAKMAVTVVPGAGGDVRVKS